MRVVLLSNSRSGRGLAQRTAAAIAVELTSAGHDVIPLAVGESHGQMAMALRGADALLLAGGDGTVHRTAMDAAGAGVPIYHLPCGNENLFAREFGMTRRSDQVLRALAAGRIANCDIARVESLASGAAAPSGVFILMCGVGLDASIIRRLTALRTKAIGHLAYVEPVIREVLAPSFPRLTIDIDGKRAVDAEQGMLIVANSRQYALRMDPAAAASMTDGLLDVVFLRCRTVVGVLRWAALARARRIKGNPGLVHQPAREIIIQSDDDAPYQLDGDAPGWEGATASPLHTPAARALSLRITLEEMKLPVLLP